MDRKERDKLYKQYRGVVPYILKDWVFPNIELKEDCYQEASLILLKAIENYDKYKDKVSMLNYLCNTLKWTMPRRYTYIKNTVKEPAELTTEYQYKRLFNKYKGIPPAEIIKENGLKSWIFDYMALKSEGKVTRGYVSRVDDRITENYTFLLDRNIDTRNLIDKVKGTLNSNQRKIIMEKYIMDENTSNSQLATMMGLSIERVSLLTRTAMYKIREQMRKEGFYYEV